MRKILLMCCVLVGITAVSRAQGGQRRTPEERAKTLQTQLKLTDNQTAKITIIYQAMYTKIDSIRSAGGDGSAYIAVTQPINDKIKAILTADQATAFQKMMYESRPRTQQGSSGN
jgi:protein CpxP